jgi:hypothetical protein
MKTIKKLTDLEQDWKYYKKKPVTIKATQLTEDEVLIETREGTLKGYKGDFIIQGIQGEIYPCGKEIFYKTYMPEYCDPDDKETQKLFDIVPMVD